jgi:hypothetical protein
MIFRRYLDLGSIGLLLADLREVAARIPGPARRRSPASAGCRQPDRRSNGLVGPKHARRAQALENGTVLLPGRAVP